MKRLVIVGGAGRMGQAMAEGLGAREDFSVVAVVDVHRPADVFGAVYAERLDDVDAASVDVVVDFSSPEGVVRSAVWCAENHKGLVVGATGLDPTQRAALEEAANLTGVVICANYSVGAVLSERFAAMAAPYFDRVEIIELHHDRKVDAPSGTAITTARAIAAARAARDIPAMVDPTQRHVVEGGRGAEIEGGVRVHSVRLPGLVAHQEVIFGAPGEGLIIRHDSFDRTSFVNGVALAANFVSAEPGLLRGIESLI